MTKFIQHFWSEDRQCNVFGVRGSSAPEYVALYEDLATPPQTDRRIKPRPPYRSHWTLSSDFPWDYFTFYDKDDADRFIEKWADYIYHLGESPPREFVKAENPEGHSWCTRCKVFHKIDPPGYDFEGEIAKKLAQEIADNIDREIIADLLKIANEIRKTDS